MDKELKALLESELLNEETKKALTEAVESLKAKAVEEAEEKLEVKYAEKLTEEKKRINEGLEKVISEAVTTEIEELKEDVERYRKMEVEYANKLEEFKSEYASKLEEGVNDLIESQVKEEMSELREDLEESKKLNFGKRLFEAFSAEFESFGFSDDMLDLKKRFDEVSSELKESQDEVMSMRHEKKVNELLEGLKGKKHDVMKTLLEGVAYDKLEERYEQTIESVLEEDTKTEGKQVSEGEEPETRTVLNESESSDDDDTKALWDKVLGKNS